MAIKSYSNIDFSIRSKKRFIQTFFYRSSKVKKSSVLMLCGLKTIIPIEDGCRMYTDAYEDVDRESILNAYDINSIV